MAESCSCYNLCVAITTTEWRSFLALRMAKLSFFLRHFFSSRWPVIPSWLFWLGASWRVSDRISAVRFSLQRWELRRFDVSRPDRASLVSRHMGSRHFSLYVSLTLIVDFDIKCISFCCLDSSPLPHLRSTSSLSLFIAVSLQSIRFLLLLVCSGDFFQMILFPMRWLGASVSVSQETRQSYFFDEQGQQRHLFDHSGDKEVCCFVFILLLNAGIRSFFSSFHHDVLLYVF